MVDDHPRELSRGLMSDPTPTSPERPMREEIAALLRSSIRGALMIRTTAAGLMPVRLPEWTRTQFDGPMLALASEQCSGVRIALSTEARWIELEFTSTRLILGSTPQEMVPAVLAVTIDGRPHSAAISNDGRYRRGTNPNDLALVPGQGFEAWNTIEFPSHVGRHMVTGHH